MVTNRNPSANNVFAIAGIVIKEMYRRKDFYVLLALVVVITLLMASVSFFHEDSIVRLLKESCLLLIWISSLVIAITTTARQIPAERESRTIFPLLAKPVGRGEYIVGKFLGCWLACGLCLLVFYFFFGLVSASREHAWPQVAVYQAIWMHWICLAVVIAMVLLGSVIFTAPSSNATISFIVVVGILFAGGHLNEVAISLGGLRGTVVYVLYYLIPHLEWFDVRDYIIHDWGRIEWLAWGGATMYGLLYSALFLSCAWAIFRRKMVAL